MYPNPSGTVPYEVGLNKCTTVDTDAHRVHRGAYDNDLAICLTQYSIYIIYKYNMLSSETDRPFRVKMLHLFNPLSKLLSAINTSYLAKPSCAQQHR